MKRQARDILSFIFSSRSGNSLALQDTSAQGSYYQRLACFLSYRCIYTIDNYESLGRQLADIAHHAYLIRQEDLVEQASQMMLALPISRELKRVAQYYQARRTMRKGNIDSARKLLEGVIAEATPRYRARALLTIGATYYERGEIDSTLPFYIAAGKAATDCDLLTLAESQQMIAVVRSLHGDHKQALDDLERLFPLIRYISKHYPTAYYNFLNSFAIELSEVGRIDEARRVCQITLASPFSAAYPNWLETRNELEAKRTSATPSIVAVSAALEPAPSRQVQKSRDFKPVCLLAFIPSAGEKTSVQTSIAIAVTAIAHLEISANILDRVRHSIIPRGPPVRL